MASEGREFEVLGFGSTHEALAAESILKDMGVPLTVIPAPRALGSLCGIAIRVEPADAERAEGLLANADVRPIARVTITDL